MLYGQNRQEPLSPYFVASTLNDSIKICTTIVNSVCWKMSEHVCHVADLSVAVASRLVDWTKSLPAVTVPSAVSQGKTTCHYHT